MVTTKNAAFAFDLDPPEIPAWLTIHFLPAVKARYSLAYDIVLYSTRLPWSHSSFDRSVDAVRRVPLAYTLAVQPLKQAGTVHLHKRLRAYNFS